MKSKEESKRKNDNGTTLEYRQLLYIPKVYRLLFLRNQNVLITVRLFTWDTVVTFTYGALATYTECDCIGNIRLK